MSSRQEKHAVNHAHKMFATGRYQADVGYTCKNVQVPELLHSPACEVQCDDFSAPQRHIRIHGPAPKQIILSPTKTTSNLIVASDGTRATSGAELEDQNAANPGQGPAAMAYETISQSRRARSQRLTRRSTSRRSTKGRKLAKRTRKRW